jgi:TPR repeat protein
MIATKYRQAGKCVIALGFDMAALSLGDLSAVSRIANYLWDGRPDVPADPKAACALIKMGMRHGDYGSIAMRAWVCIKKWKYKSPPHWYVAQRMNNLPPTDFSAIVNAWLLLNRPKSLQEAKVYDEHDKEIASMWIIGAADEYHHDRTMFEAAVCILIDRTGTWDLSKASELFNRSAIQGFPPAMWRLGDCFRYGWGVEVDLREARKWYKRASAAGCDCSKEVAELAKLLPAEETAEEMV